jgi:methionyl-tRNA formyltransferase
MRRARANGLPVVEFARGRESDLVAALRPLQPDLLCVATFPCLIPPPALTLAPLGALGLHPSLLPRRRGPDPLFWSYLDGDAVTGVSVFCLDGGADTGPVVAQQTVALPRGRSGRDAYEEIARRGAALLARSVADAAAGRLERRPQDEAAATRQPFPRPDACRVALEEAGAEWLWHVLNGLGAERLQLRANGGPPLRHGETRGYACTALQPPGTVERWNGTWRLHCRDGFVEVAGTSWTRAVRATLAGARALVR